MQKIEPVLLPPEELFSAVEEFLRQGYDADFTITGNSMWPLFRHGRDSVTLRALNRPLKKGDLILFSPQKGKYVLHRVIRLSDHSFETQGDGNVESDGAFPMCCILGRVVSVRRKGKQISCSSLLFKFSVWVWLFLLPVRKGLLKALKAFAASRFYKIVFPGKDDKEWV